MKVFLVTMTIEQTMLFLCVRINFPSIIDTSLSPMFRTSAT